MSNLDEQQNLEDFLNWAGKFETNNGLIVIDKSKFKEKIIITFSLIKQNETNKLIIDIRGEVEFEIDNFIEVFKNKFPNDNTNLKRVLIDLALIPDISFKYANKKDYDGLADQLHIFRGRIAGKKFGF